MKKIRWGVTVILICISLIGLICIAGCRTRETKAAMQKPIKIGLLLPYTGVFSSLGYNITRGMELYFDEVGWQAAGRSIELIKEDSEANGQIGLQKVRRLVERDNIDILTGVVSSTVAYAIRDYVVNNQVPFIISNAGAAELTREKGSQYIFRVSFCNGQTEYPMGVYSYNQLKHRKIVVMASDYSGGHEKATGFMDGFQSAGGKIVQEIYPKLGTTDFAPYFPQIKEADAVWVHFSGTDAIKFVQQWTEFKMKDKVPLLSSGDTVDESFLTYQKNAAAGILSSLHYSAALQTPENQNFVDKYTLKFKEEPNAFAEQGYVAAKVIVEALKKTGGNTEDLPKLLDSIRNTEFVAPQGPFRFDPHTQNVIFNTYIRRTEEQNGKMFNKVIYTMPNVADYGAAR